MLRERVSSGGEGEVSGDMDLARSLAEFQAEQAMLGGKVARTEAGQSVLQGEIMRLESVLAIRFDRFIVPGRLEGRD